MPEIRVQDLHHTFQNGTQALRGINTVIKEGEFVIICGANGSGKSVFIRHLNGLLQPTKGSVYLDDKDIQKNLKKTRQTIGMVFQDADSQIVGQTAWRDTAFGPQNLGLEKEEVHNRVEKALTAVNLIQKKDQRPHLFSGGEKRRLAVAGIIAMESQILLFDEPLSNLDYPACRQVISHIVELHKAGHTIIMITHDLGKIAAHSDKIIIMNNGIIAAEGPPLPMLDLLEINGIRRPSEKRIEEMSWLK